MKTGRDGDKVLRFEVLAEDEWQAKLNEMLQTY